MTTQVAHFRIDGEWLSDHARNLVLEGRWDHAITTLVDGLDGMTTDIAVRILKGDAKLVGVNDIDLEDDDATEYKESLAFQFSGVFVDSLGRYLRPYAVVTAWGQSDLIDQRTALTPGSERAAMKSMGNITGWRNPLHYADDPRTDVSMESRITTEQISKATATSFGDANMVLCRQITNYPHLIVRPHRLNDVSGAISALWERGVALREVGASEESEAAVAAPVVPQRIIDAMAREDRVAQVLSNMHIEPLSTIEYRKRIIEQANGDFFDLTYEVKGETRTISIPRAPFENWALWRTAGRDLALPWETVCPTGMKMVGDDPYHTDWMIGAGLDLDAMHEDGSTLNEVTFERNFEIQHEKLSFEAALLCGSGTAYGKVIHPKPGDFVSGDQIIVIPNASPRYLEAALSARAVICETGGTMAHLITVAREKEVLIMRVENARERFPIGSSVEMDASKGRVERMNQMVRDSFGEYE